MQTRRLSYAIVAVLLIVATILSACGATPTPTATPRPPTATAVPPTAVPPTATKAPAPTNTTAPAATAVPPTAVPPTATKAPAPTNTTAPVAATSPTVGPTATAIPMKCDKLATAYTAPAGQLGSPEKPLVITFVPSGDTGKITRAGTEMADCLTKMTGLTYKIEVGTSYAASIEAMGANKAQISFLATFAILLAQAKYQVEPALIALRKYTTNAVDPDKAMAGQMSPYYKGQFIANTKSGIKTMADVKGKTFCFVTPNSTSGDIIPRIIFKANGLDPDKDFKSTYAGGHDKVAISVYQGDCDAGVTFVDALTDAQYGLKTKFPDIDQKVTAFAVSDRIPNDGLQFVKGLDQKIKDITVQGLLAMMADPGGNATVKAVYSYDAFAKLDKPYYDDFAAVLKKAGVDPVTLVK
jgi:phosphonate transport system substrate-binding protein